LLLAKIFRFLSPSISVWELPGVGSSTLPVRLQPPSLIYSFVLGQKVKVHITAATPNGPQTDWCQ